MQDSSRGSSKNSGGNGNLAAKKIRAVKEVLEKKRAVGDVAREVGCTRQALYFWIKTYRRDPKSAKNSLKNSYVTGRRHHKSIPWNLERKILDLVIQEPSLGVDVLRKRLLGQGVKISTHGIYNVLLRYNLYRKDLRYRFSLDHPVKTVLASAMSPANKAKLLDEYLEGKSSVSQVCKAWNISRPTFYAWLKRYKNVIDSGGQQSDAVAALTKNYKKGWQNHKACSENVRNVVKGIVAKNPQYSVRKIFKAVPVFNGRPIVGWHGIQNILAREDLNSYQKRLSFAQGYVEKPQVEVAPLYIPQVPLYRLRQLLSPFKTIPKLLLLNPAAGILRSVLLISPVLILVLWIRFVIIVPNSSPIGLFFASVALTFGFFFLIYSMKYYISALLVLRLAQLGSEVSHQGGQRQEEDQALQSKPTSRLGRLLKALVKRSGLARVTTLKTNHLNVNLNEVELTEGKQPFVSVHVALYNEKRVVERLIKAAMAQEWYVQTIDSKPFEKSQGKQLTIDKEDQSQRSNDERLKSKEANFEVVIVDDSTDETTAIAKQILSSEGRHLVRTYFDETLEVYTSVPEINETNGVRTIGPVVKLIHRASRSGFKGAALQKALENTEPQASYITIFDADFVPYPDTLEQFVKTFQVLNANDMRMEIQRMDANISIDSHESNSPTNSHSNIAAVQGYQWHVLNKSQNWITRGVRTEYAGSYVVERAGEEIYGGLKQIAGSVYMIRADILRKFGWGKSITEDFELTLRLYEQGYKVAFTPHIQAPAEAVSTLKRLIRQRMRWAEGASYNVKVMLPRMLFGRWEAVLSTEIIDHSESIDQRKETTNYELNTQNSRVWVPSRLTRAEKLEFAYLAPYYLQAAFLVVGTFSWFISEAVIGSKLPFWTAAFGWSLVFTNLFALPLMNIIGLFLEESDERDYIGIISFIALSYIVVPFQAYAAIKGFLEREEGPWFRTPKTGLITDTFGRSGFGKFFGNILGRRQGEAMQMGFEGSLGLSYLNVGSYRGEDDDYGSLFNFKQALRGLTNAGFSVAPAFVRRARIPRKLYSRGLIALLVVFSMAINYLAIFGKNVSQLPQSEEVQAEDSGPTKLASNNSAASAEQIIPTIGEINVERSVAIDGTVDFIYEGSADGDNLIMFGRRVKTGDELHDTGVIRIVSVTGQYVQYEIGDLKLGPTKMSDTQIVYETSNLVFNFKIDRSVLNLEVTFYEAGEGGKAPVKLGFLLSEGASMRRESEKGWQIVNEDSQETIFYTSQPKLFDSGNQEVGPLGDYAKVNAKENSYRLDLGANLELQYPSTLKFYLKTNPANPVFNIGDRRDNEAADYSFVVKVPKDGAEVGFNNKKTNSVGYKYTTGDKLYNMELKMRERAAAPSKVEGSKISWELGEMEAVFEVWTDRVKADYILKSRPSKNTIDFDFYGFSMIPVKNSDGSISFFGDDGYGDNNHREVFKLDTPNVKDANGREGKINMDISASLNPTPLIPEFCQAKDVTCKEPQGYYDRKGIVTLTIDDQFLNDAAYPITIDPTTLDSSAASTATVYGSQRHLLITSDNDLVAFYIDSDSDIDASYSNDNGISWSVLSDVYVGTVDDFGAAIDSSNNVSISFSESTDVKYIKITNMITANDIDGTWTVSSPVTLDNGTTPKRPSIVIDKNVFPAVSFSFETSGGTKNSAVRFSRANADPTVATNWVCATASSCTTFVTGGATGDHIQPVASTNSTVHPVIVKAPTTATNADELVIMAYWSSNTSLYSETATVNAANYNAWTTTQRQSNAGSSTTDLSALAVDDGTNQRVWVMWRSTATTYMNLGYLNADSNAWTNDQADFQQAIEYSLAYDAQTNKIYIWFVANIINDNGIELRSYDIASSTLGGVNVFDLATAAQDLDFPSAKEDNVPTTSPGPKLDLVYTNNDNEMTPVYTVFYHTWHTKETRNYDHPTSLPTTEALTITTGNNNRSFFYDENEYDDTNSDNAVYAPGSTSTNSTFAVHAFKKTNANSTDEIQISWNGKKVTEACGSGALACTLQIYQWGNGGCTAGWGDFDTGTRTDTTTGAGTEFTLTGNRTTSLSCYYSSSTDADPHLGSSTVAVRVQTDCTTDCNLQTDVITFTFVPEKVLFLLPLAMFLPRIVRRFGWRWRGRKVHANIMRILRPFDRLRAQDKFARMDANRVCK